MVAAPNLSKMSMATSECMCTCSPEYKKRRSAVDAAYDRRRNGEQTPAFRDTARDKMCAKQAKLKAAGKDVPVCADESGSQPYLPR